jgi:hypothetical protein
MNAVLLSAHVLAAIVLVGPVTVAASLFPRQARRARADPAEGSGLRMLHRITRVYAAAALAVPVLGVATAAGLGVLGDAWVSASMALTLVAGLLLALRVLPDQRRALAGDGGPLGRLTMTTGVFNLCWAVVVVLMIVRPGSTNGLH